MTDIVECHSGSAFADKPTALVWEGQRLIIAEILSQGRTPQAKWFRVQTANGQIFELSCVDPSDGHVTEPEWHIHQF